MKKVLKETKALRLLLLSVFLVSFLQCLSLRSARTSRVLLRI